MNIKHRLLCTYWRRKIPYTETEIQKGIEDVKVWLCSPGGAGSNTLKDYIHPFMRIKSHYMAGLLTHHSTPVPTKKEGFKAIYLHRSPLDCVKSQKRRNLLKTNIKKLYNEKGLATTEEVLLQGILNQFKNWTTVKVNYPILCIKYEKMFQNPEIIGDFLGIDFSSFPKRHFKENKTDVDSELFLQFEKQIAEWNEFPDVLLREAHQSIR